MDERPAKAKENPVQRRRRILTKWRLRQILRTVPKDTRGRNVIIAYRYAHVAATLSNRLRSRVVYPWQPRPASPTADPSVRVARGKVRSA